MQYINLYACGMVHNLEVLYSYARAGPVVCTARLAFYTLKMSSPVV